MYGEDLTPNNVQSTKFNQFFNFKEFYNDFSYLYCVQNFLQILYIFHNFFYKLENIHL